MFKLCQQVLEDAQRFQAAPPSRFFSSQMAKVFGFNNTRVAEWKRLAQPLIRAYEISER